MKNIFAASRANFLPASILPFLIGASLAFNRGYPVPWQRLILGLVAIASAHLSGNLFNDYFDYKSGADNIYKKKSPFFGGSRVIQEGLYGPGQILRMALVFLAISLLSVALIFFITRDVLLLFMFALAGLLTLEYTAPPLRLSYNRLGEIDIFLLFGVFLVMGSFYLFAGKFTLDAFLLSLPISFLVAAVIICNEIPDFMADIKAGKNNLISLTGPDRGYLLYAIAVLFSFIFLLINIKLGNLPVIALGLLAIYPIAIKVILILNKKAKDLGGFINASKGTIMLHSLMGGLTVIVLLLKR